MNRKTQNALVILIAIFTNTSTFGQVLAIEQCWIKMPLLIINTCACGYFLWVYFNNRPPLPSNQSIEEISKKLTTQNIHFHYVRSEAELDYVWQIDSKIYKEYNIKIETLYEWYSKYKTGTLLMFKGFNFSGYIGFYPLYKESFDKIRTRKLKEDDISPQDICSDAEAPGCTTWYFSGFALYDDNLFKYLLSEAFRNWGNFISETEPIHAISFAYPGKDEKFLHAIGFNEVREKESEKELAIVFRTFFKSEILQMADSIGGDLSSL